MRIIVGYPPLESVKGTPLLGQNRQFQWVHQFWSAYPMVPAYAATMLKVAGHEVTWLDGIAEGLSYQKWLKKALSNNPDLVFIETKTPVIKRHWQIIDELKSKMPKTKLVLMGDHVTALPKESFENSNVDYVLTGGDYDFLAVNLVKSLDRGGKLKPGIWFRKGKKIGLTGKFRLSHNLDLLPFIDRKLTKWWLYAYRNSNYKRIPGTYTMFGRDCWWGKCTFCSWTTLYPGNCYRAITPNRALDEISHLIKDYQIKEVMDDSGTFPVGDWLKTFCLGMIKRGYHRKIKIDCNMRFNSKLKGNDYRLMKKSGFRLLLYGLESANQKTLDRLNKGLKIAEVRPVLRQAKDAGLQPHLTVMVGYPWETKLEAEETLNFAKSLVCDNLIDSIQATMIVPYPGTPLFEEAKKRNWLRSIDWSDYDMSQSVLKTKLDEREMMDLIKGFYRTTFSLPFLSRKVREALSDKETFRYYLRLIPRLFGKLSDFSTTKGE